MVVSAAES